MKNTITNEEFDRRFDDGEDVTEYLDMTTIRHANQESEDSEVSAPDYKGRTQAQIIREGIRI